MAINNKTASPDYTERIKTLMEKINEAGYGMDKMYDDAQDACDFIGKELDHFPQYVNIVIKEQVMIPLWKITCEPEEYKTNVMQLDRSRRIAHDCCIDTINIINRQCDKFGVERLTDVDTKNRTAVAEFVGDYVQSIYNKGINGKGMDGASYGRRQEYPTDHVAKLMAEMEHIENTSQDNAMELG